MLSHILSQSRHGALVALGLGLVLTGCFENVGTEKRGGSSTAGGSSIGGSSSGGSGKGGVGGANSPQLERVLKNTIDPNGTLDLVGNFGEVCKPQPASGPGATSCICRFGFVRAGASGDQGPETFDVETLYAENELLRCKYSDIPSDARSITVKVITKGSNSASATLSFDLSSGGGALNPADPLSFAKALRYQCRDSVFIPNPLDGRVYDPIQSEDPEMAYPLNFYTSNLGGTLAMYSASKAPGIEFWNCQPNPATDRQALVPGFNMNLFSLQPLPSSGNPAPSKIFPAAGNKDDRYTFYLAKSLTGAFDIPVRAYFAPGVVTGASNPLGKVPPLGFGAKPDPKTELCPSNVSKPKNYKWVKLWLFRYALERRKYFVTSQIGAGGLGAVSCNPGKFANNTVIFSECGATGRSFPNSSSELADRILTIGTSNASMCVNTHPTSPACGDSGAGCTTALDASGNLVQRTGQSGVPQGTDIWIPRGTFCSSHDPLGICTSNAPHAAATQATVDQDDRADYLFVVSPESVKVSDMQSGNPTGQMYQPVRFISARDCSADNPDDPSCNSTTHSKRLNYDIKLHGVTMPGDPAGNDPDREPEFPVCALQPE